MRMGETQKTKQICTDYTEPDLMLQFNLLIKCKRLLSGRRKSLAHSWCEEIWDIVLALQFAFCGSPYLIGCNGIKQEATGQGLLQMTKCSYETELLLLLFSKRGRNRGTDGKVFGHMPEQWANGRLHGKLLIEIGCKQATWAPSAREAWAGADKLRQRHIR